MLKKLLTLLGEPLNPSKDDKGEVRYFLIPSEETVSAVVDLLGISINKSTRARSLGPNQSGSSDVYLRLVLPNVGSPTACLYGIPWDQTDDAYLDLSETIELV